MQQLRLDFVSDPSVLIPLSDCTGLVVLGLDITLTKADMRRLPSRRFASLQALELRRFDSEGTQADSERASFYNDWMALFGHKMPALVHMTFKEGLSTLADRKLLNRLGGKRGQTSYPSHLRLPTIADQIELSIVEEAVPLSRRDQVI